MTRSKRESAGYAVYVGRHTPTPVYLGEYFKEDDGGMVADIFNLHFGVWFPHLLA